MINRRGGRASGIMVQRSKAEFDKLVVDAIALHRAGRLRDAEVTYRAALDIAPGQPVATHNLGVVVAAQGRHSEAIRHFDEAIAAEPQYASAHYNRAVGLEAIGRTRDAIHALSRVCAIEPEHYASHRALGFLWLAEGERGRALDHLSRTYELRRGDDRTGIAAGSLTTATRGKLRHDAAQFRYLASRRRDGQRFEMMAQAYEAVARDVSDEPAPLSKAQFHVLGEDYNTAINNRGAPELADGAVSVRTDREELVRRFREGRAGAVYFDDLLAPQALANLKRYLLESTIWHDFSHIGGFVASYLEDGLACPLLLQIAAELRDTFPELLGPHPLSQAWAFKALESRAAVDAHADDAAVSVNFWVTPDEANLKPGRGGLAVCRVPPPPDWEVKGYHADRDQIVAFLAQYPDEMLVVPYRENRAVLFESRLFHQSDTPQFAETYEDRRINLTLLFGRHG